MELPARLTVGVVGTGRVGAVLGAALSRAGHTVVAASAVSAASRDRAADLLPGVPVVGVEQVLQQATLVLLTVPDDALEDLVSGLVVAGAVQPGQLLAHTSGRYGLAVLEPAVRVGALPLALHPVLPFAGTRVDLERLHGTAFGVTAPEALRPVAEVLVVEMGGEPVIVAEADRAAYAEAVETATAFSTSIVEQASGLLAGIGIDHPGAMIAPLMRSAMENALARTSPDRLDLAQLDALDPQGTRDQNDFDE